MGEDGHTGARSEVMRKDHDSVYTATHSVFAAPLVEWILLRYGGEAGGHILDAFAGGPPRGLVLTIMGYKYTGFEIRQEQIDENVATLKALKLEGAEYICGDGRFDSCRRGNLGNLTLPLLARHTMILNATATGPTTSATLEPTGNSTLQCTQLLLPIGR